MNEKKTLIFGSCATKHWFPDFRVPNDLDIIERDGQYWVPAFEYLFEHNQHDQYVDPNFLYTIKLSHAQWNVHWDKTMKDQLWLRDKGCVIDQTFYDLLIKDWSIKHGPKKVKMNVRNEDFFTNTVTRQYDHDWLHEYLAHGERPMHEHIRPDLGSPLCSKKMFNALSFEDQLLCALEETEVLATERYVLPQKKPLKHAKYLTLRQMILSTCSGWFAKFLIQHFDTLIYEDTTLWHTKLQDL